jgi:DNA recombination protein RmuC
MDIVLLIVLVLLTGIASAILYLNIKSKPKNENKEAEEMANLKSEITNLKDTLNTTINNSLGSMSTSFNALSTGVTKDMTETLTKVEEKVGSFNQQVQLLNQSQEGITKILAGVKKYGTLAEFSLDALIKDLLPASQFMTNVKMQENTSENVEFAIKLQGRCISSG